MCLLLYMSFETKKIILLILSLTLLLTAEALPITANDIFGVRWFLGEEFRLQAPIPPDSDIRANCHLMLIFNTHTTHPSLNFSVTVGVENFKCYASDMVVNVTSNHHENFNQFASKVGDIFSVYIQKCPITFRQASILDQVQDFSYIIKTGQTQQKEIVFRGILRSPTFGDGEVSIATLGDWGIITNFSQQYRLSEPITECLQNQIERRKELKVMLLLGDLGYDLEGKTYVKFLTYLSVFSSRLVILLTPGNHQSIRHQDIFLLFKESFYSPQWSRFYGYFDLISLKGHILLNYNPEHLFSWLNRTSHSSLFQISLKEEFKNYTNLFALQFPSRTRQLLKSKTVIAFSHYPTYCSKKDDTEDCDKYKELASEFTTSLQQMGVDLFFSGHVHTYERTKQLCRQGFMSEGLETQMGFQYWIEEGCSIFVIEGVAGNNYFVDTTPADKQKLKNHSQVAASNTGFGVLTLNYNNTNDLHFTHLSVIEGCWPADHFVLHPRSTPIDGVVLVIWMGCGLVIIGLGVFAAMKIRVLWLRRKHRKGMFSIKLAENDARIS